MPVSVGCRLLSIRDAVQGIDLPVAVLYPADTAEEISQFGPYSVSVAMNAPMTGEGLPLVVISHGNGGSPWTLRELAAFLARHRFVVALPEHLGNRRSDNSLANTVANLANRPRHLSLAIDAALNDPTIAGHLAADRVAAIGMSIGGYSMLAAAGGRPWGGPHETDGGAPRPIQVTPDHRLRALVLLAPATPWFQPEGSLSDIKLLIQIWTGDQDDSAPAWHANLVQRGVGRPDLVEHRIIPGAGHFSFLSPFPTAMVNPAFPPSQDPPGFDRAGLQPILQADIMAFLRRTT